MSLIAQQLLLSLLIIALLRSQGISAFGRRRV